MENEKKEVIQWVKEHKKEMLVAGASIATVIAGVLIVNTKEDLSVMLKKLFINCEYTKTKIIEQPTNFNMVIDNGAELIEPFTEISTPCNEIVKIYQDTFDVNSHIRNLAEGLHASAEKIATAMEHGYILESGQTWVKTYSKGKLVA